MQRRKLIKSTLPQRAAQSGARLTDLTTQDYQATPGTQPGLPEAYANAWSRGLFAPGAPVTPLITDDEQPRIFDYASGINLYFTPRGGYDLLPFPTLRQFARLCEEINIVKEAIKRETRALDWDIVPIDDKDNTDYSSEIARLRAWWESPDGLCGFDQWQNMLMEEMLVLDAAAIWFGNNGKRDVAYIFDGSIIRPLLDERGMTPDPPVPAYVSYIKGRNWQWFTSDRLIYRPFNAAANSPYGMSPTEFFVLRVNEAIRRKMSAASYWDSTNIPEMLAGLPETWTTQQIEEFQAYWDALLTGDIDKLRRMKFLPAKAGTLPVHEVRRPTENSQADEWMLRLACWCFGILPSEIGLVTGSKGLGGKGFLEGQENAEFRFGFGPVVKYLQSLYTQMTRRLTNQPLKWMFTDIGPQEDRTSEFALQQAKLFAGAIDINVIRQAEGQEPIPDAQPFIVVGNQITLLKDLFNPKTPAQPNPFGGAGATAQNEQPPAKATGVTVSEQPPEVLKVALGEWREKVKRRMADGKPALCDPPQHVKALIPQGAIDHVRQHLTNDANALGVFSEPFLAKAAGAKHATAQRDQIEASLRQKLAATLKDLPQDSYDPDSIISASDSYWQEFKTALIEALGPELASGYLLGVDEARINPLFQPSTSVSVDWTLVNNSAVQAARDHTLKLSGELTENTVSGVQDAVTNWIEQGGALSDLTDAINELIDDPVRAETIAQTESTRAFAAGNKTAWRAAGVPQFTFHTVEDSIVCTICEANDGQVFDMDDADNTPPIHVRCRCYIQPMTEEGDNGE